MFACLYCFSAISASALPQQPNETAIRQMPPDERKVHALLGLAASYIDLPGSDQKDMSAARIYITSAQILSAKLRFIEGQANSFIYMSKIYRESGNGSEGIAAARKSLNYFRRHPYLKAASDAYFEMANYYDINSDSSTIEKIYYYKRGVTCLEKRAPNTIQLADAFKFLGDLYNCNVERDNALIVLHKALAIYRSLGKQNLQETYCLIGTALLGKNDFKEAVKYHLLAVKAVQLSNDSSATAIMVYNRLAVAYSFIGNHKKALSCYKDAFKLAERSNESDGLIVARTNIAAEYLFMHQERAALKELKLILNSNPTDPGDRIMLLSRVLSCYTILKDFELAKPYYFQLIPLLKNKDLKNLYYQKASMSMMQYLFKTKQYGEVGKYVYAFKEVPVKYISSDIGILAQDMIYQLDSIKGDFRSALRNRGILANMQFENLKKSKDKEVARLQIEYETQKKDQELAFSHKNVRILQQKNAMQVSALLDQKLIRNLFIAGAALLALLLAMSFNRYQLKKKANSRLSEQQEEINSQNDYLKELLQEREWLLKEIHHRVKNNLQIVISLLNSQSLYLTDPAMLDVLRESQNRMNSISLIHQKLYQEDNLGGVYMPNYIYELTQHLRSSFAVKGSISFKTDIAPVTLDVGQAVPLGLILNEAITNAIKYAFGDQEHGNIHIELKEPQPGNLELYIIDNGYGFPAEFKPEDSTSLGMSLMHGLAGQLDADMEITGTKGVRIMLKWRHHNLVNEKLNV